MLTGRYEVEGAGAGPSVRDLHGVGDAAGRARDRPAGSAAIVFQALATSEFEATLRDMEEVVKATGSESGTTVSTEDDSYGYRWMVLRNAEGTPSVEDLAVGINAVSGSIEMAGHGERLLCAVFAFADAKGRRIYFIYNYKRGFWYPFVPDARARAGAKHRARAAAQGADGLGAADRARDRALVPPVGDPDLGGVAREDQPLAGELRGRLGERGVGRAAGSRPSPRARRRARVFRRCGRGRAAPRRPTCRPPRRPAPTAWTTGCSSSFRRAASLSARSTAPRPRCARSCLACSRSERGPSPGEICAAAPSPPLPSSPFIFASSSSTAPAARELLQLLVDVVFAAAELR